jgi:hypothetical protein
MSTLQEADESLFAKIRDETELGTFWRPVDKKTGERTGHPQLLVIQAVKWSVVVSKFDNELRDVLNGRDESGFMWAVDCRDLSLKEQLVEGDVPKWNADTQQFESEMNLGRVEAGEYVAIKVTSTKQKKNRNGQWFWVVNYRVKRFNPDGSPKTAASDSEFPAVPDDDIRY